MSPFFVSVAVLIVPWIAQTDEAASRIAIAMMSFFISVVSLKDWCVGW